MLLTLANRIVWPLVVCPAVLLGGCGKTVSADPQDVDAGVVDDAVAPMVTSVSPESGAVGIVADAFLEVQFSEPMDRSSVESAWISAELPIAEVTFEWNVAGTVLTVTPTAPLALAQGIGLDPDIVSRLLFGYQIGETATDLAGNTLTGPSSFEFSTKREMTVEMAPIQTLTRTLRSDGLVFGDTALQLSLGDTVGNLQTKAFASFVVPIFPAGSEVTRATFFGDQTSTIATPYVLGNIQAFHVSTGVIDAAAATEALSMIGDFSTTITEEVKQIEVTTEFIDDVTNRVEREDRTQFRLEFPTATNLNTVRDEARYSRLGFEMSVVYQVD